MQPASLCFDPLRIGIIQAATGCEKRQAITALYDLEQHDWQQFKAKPGQPVTAAMRPKPSARMQTAHQQLKNLLIREGMAPEQAVHCTQAYFLELARLFGKGELYIANPEWMQRLLAVLSAEEQ